MCQHVGLLFVALFLVPLLAVAEPDTNVDVRSFGRVLHLEEKGENSAGVSVGDLNADEWLDIVLAKGRHTPLHNRVLLNNKTGGFIAANLGEHADRSFAAVLVDIDGDKDLDVVIGNDGPDQKIVYRNDGTGRFATANVWGERSWPTRFVSVADFNADGHPDIVAANAGASLPLPIPYPSFACLGDGNGAFPSCQPLPTESAAVIPVADFDGDGAVDLFVPHRDGGRSFILWTSKEVAAMKPWPRTPFRERTYIGPEKGSVRVAATGDLDGNGRTDIIIHDEATNRTSILLNSGSRSFEAPFALPTAERKTYALAVADLNRDGRMDIVAGYINAPGSVFFNMGDGRTFNEVPWNDGQGIVYQIAFGDLDRDGWIDIVAARTGAPNAVWFNSKPLEGK